jgi:geranylgeranyl pyrophosphate synthase
LRRSKAAAHKIFGVAQTINSANHTMIEAIKLAKEMQEPEALKIVLEEIQNLHIGQGHDLHWTRHASCPTEDEYLQMVSMSKTIPQNRSNIGTNVARNRWTFPAHSPTDDD